MSIRAPVRALLAEDEPILAAALGQALRRLWPELEIAAVAENGIAAVELALAQRPDVLFLDIKMPGKTGLEAAQELAEEWPEESPFPLIVFVTAYDDHALEAFEHAAVDYVVKPVEDARLGKTVTRLKSLIAKGREDGLEHAAAQLRALTSAAPAAEKLTVIRAAVGNHIRMIPIDDVLYFEATDKYVNVVTKENESLIRTSLKELLPQLDGRHFWQIHRSVVVNARCIRHAARDENGKLSVSLKDHPASLPVSRIYAHLFRQM